MPPRQNLRTIVYFLLSLLLVPAYCVLVSEKAPSSISDGDKKVFSSQSLGFYSFSSTTSSSYYYLLPTLPSNQSNSERYHQITSCASSSSSNNNSESSAADFILIIILIVFGFVVVAPTLIAVYLDSDAQSYSSLDSSRRLAIFTSIVSCVFSALMLVTVIVSYVQEKDRAEEDRANKNINNNNNSNNGDLSLEWSWPILMLGCILFTLIFIPWSIWRVIIMNSVKIDFPEEEAEENDDEAGKEMKESDHNSKEKTTNEPFQDENNTNNNHSTNDTKDQQPVGKLRKREQVLFQAATLTFYKTRNGIGRFFLLFVCIMSIIIASGLSSVSWFSRDNKNNNDNTTSYSPIFGSCTTYIVSANNYSSIICPSPLVESSSSSLSNIGEERDQHRFLAIYRGLNGTGLVFAIFLIIGTVMQWTWCLVPTSLVACSFSLAVIGVGVHEKDKQGYSCGDNNNNSGSIEMGWLFWLQVGTAVVWMLTAISGILIQCCVSDGTDDDEKENENEKKAEEEKETS